MKSKMLFAVLLGVMLAMGSAFGQTARADIPFDFAVGNSTLPAGEYIVAPLVGSGSVVSIRSLDGRSQVYVQTGAAESGSTPRESKLVFHIYRDRYFLSQVWVAGEATGHTLPVSIREREMARGAQLQEASLLGK